MARQFSHPQIQQLEVGDTESIYGTDAEVLKRRVDGYAKRARRKFLYTFDATSVTDPHGIRLVGHNVTRLPDPEPEVA